MVTQALENVVAGGRESAQRAALEREVVDLAICWMDNPSNPQMKNKCLKELFQAKVILSSGRVIELIAKLGEMRGMETRVVTLFRLIAELARKSPEDADEEGP